MADRYWVGGTGTWTTTTTNWSASSGGSSGASAPTAADSVFFNQAATYTVTMTGALTCLDITVSAGTVTFATGTGPTLAVSGSMSLLAGTVWNSTGLITLNPVANKTISTNGVTINASITFTPNPTTVSLTLNTALTTVNTGTFTLTQGILILNNFTLSTGIFSTPATNVRQIQFGTGNIALIHPTAATTVLVIGNYSNFTCSGTGGFTSAMTVTRTFNIVNTGQTSTNKVSLALTSGTSLPTFGQISVNHLNFTGSSISMGSSSCWVSSLTLSSGGTYTSFSVSTLGTGTITTLGKTILDFTVIGNTGDITTLADALTTSVTSATQVSTGTLNLANFSITTGRFLSTNSFTRAIAFGTGNIVLSHTTAGTTVLDMSRMIGFTWTGTGGFTVAAMSVTRSFTVGVTSGGTSSNAPNLTFTTGASIATFTTGAGGTWYNKLDFGTTSFNPATFASLNLNALTLSSTGTYTSLSVTMAGTGTITSNGKTIVALVVSSAGTTTLAAALSCLSYTQSAGNVNFATFNLTCSASAAFTAGTLSNIGTITCTTWTVNGTFTLTQGTITPSSNFTLQSGAFNYNGGTITTPSLVHTAGTVTLGANLSLSVTGTYTLTAGTLALAGFTLTTGIFSSNNANTRAITFGTGNIALSHTTAATVVLSMATTTGFTYTGTGGFTVAAMNNTRTFTVGSTAGGTTSNAPNLTFTTGASVATLTTASWFNKLDFGTTSFNPGTTTLNLNALTLSSSGTYTSLSATMRGTGTITPNGKTIAAFTVNTAGTVTLAAALSCTTYTQTTGTINFATFNLTCSGAAAYTAGTLSNIGTITCTTWTVTGTFTLTQGTITPSTSFVLTSGAFNYNGGTLSAVPTFTHTAGTVTLGQSYALTTTGTYTQTAGTLALAGFTLSTGIFTSTNSNTRAITFGTGNINLTHTTAATMVLSMDTLTNFTYTGTGGFTVADMSNTRTFNVGTTGGTTSNAPNLTFTTGASVATIVTGNYFGNLNFGTTSFNPGTTALNVNALTLSSSGTYTSLSATMVGTGTITTNAKTIVALTVNNAGTATLADALTMSGAFTLISGTLVCGVYNVQSATFASTGIVTRSMTGSGTYTITGSGATAFSNASAAGITMSGFTISMTSASAKTFAGGGGTYPTLNQGGAGALTISGNNSFADLTATTIPSTITFTISTTQTFTAFTLSGTAGNLVTINSSTPGSQATLSKSSGTISVDYLSIQDCLATGGATWYAGANSTDVSNNSGWIFTAPPSTATGNFFLFF